MIIVTGPGRAGTTLVAKIYRALGFDPGGRYMEEVRAGLEAREARRMNETIAHQLRMTMHKTAESHRAMMKLRSKLLGPLLMNWNRLHEVVAEHGEQLRDIASSLVVVKDPRFSWTLPVWAAANADIEHVLIATRPLSSMTNSRIDAGLTDLSTSDMRNAIVYGFGMLTTTVHTYEIPHAFLRFPDWLDDPMMLYEAARWPRDIGRDEFLEAFRRNVRPDFVRY